MSARFRMFILVRVDVFVWLFVRFRSGGGLSASGEAEQCQDEEYGRDVERSTGHSGFPCCKACEWGITALVGLSPGDAWDKH